MDFGHQATRQVKLVIFPVKNKIPVTDVGLVHLDRERVCFLLTDSLYAKDATWPLRTSV